MEIQTLKNLLRTWCPNYRYRWKIRRDFPFHKTRKNMEQVCNH